MQLPSLGVLAAAASGQAPLAVLFRTIYYGHGKFLHRINTAVTNDSNRSAISKLAHRSKLRSALL
jgi:hypothetical protein